MMSHNSTVWFVRLTVPKRTVCRDDEPLMDGWRWSKWGEYIGSQNPTQEYLAMEPDIEEVLVYRIILLEE